MPEIIRTRDCVVLYKGDTLTVAVDPAWKSWQGGQGACWMDSPKDEFRVTMSDGRFGGFLLWGSDEPSDQFVSMVGQQPAYGYALLCVSSWLMLTRTFEQYTWASRNGGGPLVPLTYAEGRKLYFSLRGYWTIEDEWTASSDPRGPNTLYVGQVVQAPRPNAKGDLYLTVQTSL